MKKIRCVLVFLVLFCMGMSVQAANPDKVVDQAELLTQQEEQKLEKQFLQIAEKYRVDVAVLTTDSCKGKTPSAYTEDYYEAHHYGYGEEIDGIMLMVSMEERDYWISTRGKAIRIFTDSGLLQLEDTFLEDLSDGEYYRAFSRFGETAEAFMEQAENGRPYDVGNQYKQPMSMGVRALISVGVGLAVTAAVMLVLFMQLRSVRVKQEARDYVRAGSFRVTRARDLYLYRTVHRQKIEKAASSGGGSSTHRTSSGGNAGGHGGKF